MAYFSQHADIQVHMTIDGSVHSRRLKPDRLHSDRYSTIRTSATTVRRLLFSTMELTGMRRSTWMLGIFTMNGPDDDAYLGKTGPKNLGEISLSLKRVNVICEIPHVKGVVVPPDQKVHERSKKGMTHCKVSFFPLSRLPPHLKSCTQDLVPKCRCRRRGAPKLLISTSPHSQLSYLNTALSVICLIVSN